MQRISHRMAAHVEIRRSIGAREVMRNVNPEGPLLNLAGIIAPIVTGC